MRSIRPLREWPRGLSARRLVLLATVASLGVAGLAIGSNGFHQAPTYAVANAAESTQRPVGFADLVQKVKPAVISVRVKVDAGAEMREHTEQSASAARTIRNWPGLWLLHHCGWLCRYQQPRRGQGESRRDHD